MASDRAGSTLKFFSDEWGGLSLSEIQPDRVASARDTLLATRFRRSRERIDKQGKVVAPKTYARAGGTVNRYLATLSHLFTLAMKERNLLDRNPVRGISKAKESLCGDNYLGRLTTTILAGEHA
jgi:hypothetical protein